MANWAISTQLSAAETNAPCAALGARGPATTRKTDGIS